MIKGRTNRDKSRTCPDCPGRDGQGQPPIGAVPCPGVVSGERLSDIDYQGKWRSEQQIILR